VSLPRRIFKLHFKNSCLTCHLHHYYFDLNCGYTRIQSAVEMFRKGVVVAPVLWLFLFLPLEWPLWAVKGVVMWVEEGLLGDSLSQAIPIRVRPPQHGLMYFAAAASA